MWRTFIAFLKRFLQNVQYLKVNFTTKTSLQEIDEAMAGNPVYCENNIGNRKNLYNLFVMPFKYIEGKQIAP